MYRTAASTFLLLVILSLVGCCTPARPPQPVPRPTPLATDSLEPKALANRMLTSLLISSPLATVPRASVFVGALTGPTAPPQLVAALQHLAQLIAVEPRFQLVTRPENATHRLSPTLTDAPATFRLHLFAADATTPTWQFTQSLDN